MINGYTGTYSSFTFIVFKVVWFAMNETNHTTELWHVDLMMRERDNNVLWNIECLLNLVLERSSFFQNSNPLVDRIQSSGIMDAEDH